MKKSTVTYHLLTYHLFSIQYGDDFVYAAVDRCDFEKARQIANNDESEIPTMIRYLGEVTIGVDASEGE